MPFLLFVRVKICGRPIIRKHFNIINVSENKKKGVIMRNNAFITSLDRRYNVICIMTSFKKALLHFIKKPVIIDYKKVLLGIIGWVIEPFSRNYAFSCVITPFILFLSYINDTLANTPLTECLTN